VLGGSGHISGEAPDAGGRGRCERESVERALARREGRTPLANAAFFHARRGRLPWVPRGGCVAARCEPSRPGFLTLPARRGRLRASRLDVVTRLAAAKPSMLSRLSGHGGGRKWAACRSRRGQGFDAVGAVSVSSPRRRGLERMRGIGAFLAPLYEFGPSTL